MNLKVYAQSPYPDTFEPVGSFPWHGPADRGFLEALRAGDLGDLPTGTYVLVPSPLKPDDDRIFLLHVEREEAKVNYRVNSNV